MTLLPNLIRSGSVGPVWPRLRHRAAEYGAAGLALEQAYQSQRAHNAAVEREVARAVTRLRAVGIDPVFVKGLAISRLYATPAIRPAGDIDLIVRPAEYETARVALDREGDEAIRGAVDLQQSPWWMKFDGFGLFERAQLISVDRTWVRLPSDEAHLRLACLHMLRHGAMRPVWLCDVAVLLEARGRDFDWGRCVGRNKRQRGWILTALRLAHEVLGADITGTPAADERGELPRWLVPAVLARWEKAEPLPPAVASQYWRDPAVALVAMRTHWQDPVRATVTCNAPFSQLPRLPIQCAAFTIRCAQFGTQQLSRLRHSSSS